MSQATTEDTQAAPHEQAPASDNALEVLPQDPAGEAQNPVAELQAEVDKWKDTALRSAAELDNYRKRVNRDMQDSRAYANVELLRTLLPILDNFEMGMEAARAENEKGMIFLGLNMVRGQFQSFLKEQGAEEIPALCQPFDPKVHEAMGQEPHPEAPEGTIIKVLRKGYKIKDRLLRPSNVIVSSGPPKSDEA